MEQVDETPVRPSYKRRNYMINPGFQLRFMFYVAFAILVGLYLVYLSNLWYFETVISEGQEIGLDASHPYFEFIEQQRLLLTKTYLTVSAVVFAVLMLFGLFLSHHIAGPLYRITSYMNQIASGETDLPPVTLRKRDFFTEVADSLNNMLAEMKRNQTNRKKD